MRPCTELMLTRTPLPRSLQRATTAWTIRSGPSVLTSSTRATSSRGKSSRGPRPVTTGVVDHGVELACFADHGLHRIGAAHIEAENLFDLQVRQHRDIAGGGHRLRDHAR